MEKITGKTIYILGAGASRHTGAPLLRDFLVTARLLSESNPELKHRSSFNKVIDWSDRLRGSSYYVDFDLDNLEHMFSLCEMLRQVGGDDGLELSLSMKHLVMETLDRRCKLEWRKGQFHPDPLYEKFVKLFHEINDGRRTALGKAKGSQDFENDIIISFNYDVMLDYALWFHNMPPEYCLFPSPFLGHKYRLFKLHGSINWAMCQECLKKGPSTTIQVIRPTPIPLQSMLLQAVDGAQYEMRMMTEVLPKTECQFCKAQNVLEPVVIPPTWSKAVGNTPLAPVWAQAVNEIRTAFQIIVIGYSLPSTDTFFQYLLTLGLANNSQLNRIVVVDVDQSSSFEKRYTKVFSRSLSDRGRLQFLRGTTFSDFVYHNMGQFGRYVGG